MNQPTVIERLIQGANGKSSAVPEKALIALGAMPVPWAWEGCLGIKSNGEVIYVNDEGTQIPVSSFGNERKDILGTLVYASRHYPELTYLLPSRPLDAFNCTTCDGSGSPHQVANALCGACLGLGWRIDGGENAT